jgi:hypothetical protein
LANSDFTIKQSRLLAQRLWRESSDVPDLSQREAEFVRSAFEQVLSQTPSDEALRASLEYLAQQKRELAAASPPATEVSPSSSDPAQRSRETLIHALFNQNEFVTIR